MIKNINDAIRATNVQIKQLPYEESSKNVDSFNHDMSYYNMVLDALEFKLAYEEHNDKNKNELYIQMLSTERMDRKIDVIAKDLCFGCPDAPMEKCRCGCMRKVTLNTLLNLYNDNLRFAKTLINLDKPKEDK